MTERDDSFDWVTAARVCDPLTVLTDVREIVTANVETANAGRPGNTVMQAGELFALWQVSRMALEDLLV